jgi:hypothetical protein
MSSENNLGLGSYPDSSPAKPVIKKKVSQSLVSDLDVENSNLEINRKSGPEYEKWIMQKRAEGERKLVELGLVKLVKPPLCAKPKKAVFSKERAPPTRPLSKRAGPALLSKVPGKSKGKLPARSARDGLLSDESDQEVIPEPKKRMGFEEQEQANCTFVIIYY